MMPSMDGWAVLTALKADAATAEIPVVMMTMVEDKPMGFALGAADYLTKPIDKAKVLAAVSRRVGRSGEDVLIVEDDPMAADIVRRTLESGGFRTRHARNGREALEHLRQNPGVDLVLMDIMMPVIDGLEATREIRKQPQFAKLPIIALTAKAMSDDCSPSSCASSPSR